MDFAPHQEHASIRDAITKICSHFDDAYWLERDRVGGFPHELHRALADGETPHVNKSPPQETLDIDVSDIERKVFAAKGIKF